MVHVRFDSPVTRFIHGVAENRGRRAALVAAARKLATVCYSVLVNGGPYFYPLDAQAWIGFVVEALTPLVVVVRAIGGAWWRSVILPRGLWADRRMQILSRRGWR